MKSRKTGDDPGEKGKAGTLHSGISLASLVNKNKAGVAGDPWNKEKVKENEVVRADVTMTRDSTWVSGYKSDFILVAGEATGGLVGQGWQICLGFRKRTWLLCGGWAKKQAHEIQEWGWCWAGGWHWRRWERLCAGHTCGGRGGACWVEGGDHSEVPGLSN